MAWSIAFIPRAEDVDSGSYRLMARGEPACLPYANRILHPALAGFLWRRFQNIMPPKSDDIGASPTCCRPLAAPPTPHPLTHPPSSPKNSQFSILNSQFLLIAVISSLVFYLCILSLLRDVRPRWLVFVLLVSPLWWVWGGNIYIQDMFAAALTALLLLLLRSSEPPSAVTRPISSCCRPLAVPPPPPSFSILNSQFSIPLILILILFLLQLTRESTTLLSLVLIALALFRRRWRLAAGAFAAMAAGMAVVAWASRDALPSANELGGGVYLVAKAVANGVRNFTGVIPWNDGYAARLPWYYPDPPVWKCALPTFLQMGNVHEVGIYKFMPGVVLRTFVLWFLYFPGAIVLLLKCVSRTRGQEESPPNPQFPFPNSQFSIPNSQFPFYVQYSFIIGLVFWLLAPFSGPSLDRLVGYAWPFFWVAFPFLLCRRA